MTAAVGIEGRVAARERREVVVEAVDAELPRGGVVQESAEGGGVVLLAHHGRRTRRPALVNEGDAVAVLSRALDDAHAQHAHS